jgi:flagellar basal-body rod protein FlgF
MCPVNNGIYAACSGLRAQVDALDLLANNLANLNTAGFKEELAYFSPMNQAAEASANAGDIGASINSLIKTQGAINTANGSLSQTNRDLDVAIEGNGFLVVETPRGIRYTRNGSLMRNAKGVLVASEGSPILGASGRPITLGPGAININEEGAVTVDGKEIDRMKIVSFDDLTKISREGNSLLLLQNGRDQEKVSSAKIRCGYLEQSNVNAVSSVVRMVQIMRQFEAIQKTVNLVMNEMNSKSIEKLGH